jgi:RNA polymerase sigma factor (sigma-70 family)
VYAVARNIWMRRLSRRNRERPLTGAVEERTADTGDILEQLIDDEQAEMIRRAMERLGEPCRTILLLFYWEEKSMDDIAAAVGLANAETAKARKYQCKKALEQLVEVGDGTPR